MFAVKPSLVNPGKFNCVPLVHFHPNGWHLLRSNLYCRLRLAAECSLNVVDLKCPGVVRSMCGRYTQTHTHQEIMERFDLDALFMDLDPRYNISPTQTVPIILERDTDDDKTVRVLDASSWGLIPGFVKDPRLLKPMINARAETLMEKRMFKGAFLSRRCLIPADGFYEWLTENKKKQPVRFQVNNGELFAFAGIYEEGKDLEGNPRRTCSIITVAANETVSPVHDRMPAILKIEDEKRWIDHSLNDPKELMEMLNPCDNAIIDWYRCSTVVNSSRSDSKNCILRAGTPEALEAEEAQRIAAAEAKANKASKGKAKKDSGDEGVQLIMHLPN